MSQAPPPEAPLQETDACPPALGQIRKFWLHVTEGPDAGVSYSSQRGQATVGTAPGVDLRLHDRAVSKYHCEFVIQTGQVLLRDLASRNGTTVAGIRVREAYLEHGATLTLGRSRLRFELDAALLTVPASTAASFGRLLGTSEAMRRVFARLEQARDASAPVLLVGEAGTGKATAAQALHTASGRSAGPLLVIDCATTPAPLLEAALFGADGGEGALESSRGGTLYLEEISAMSPRLQLRLAQALDRKQCAGRFIASTQRDLRAEVNLRRFHADLYYHLAVIEILLPPLRERPDDLPLLLRHLAAEASPDAPPDFPPEQLDGLTDHGWPGNVRELRAYVERCLALGRRAPLASESPAEPHPVDIDAPLRLERERWVEDLERRYLTRQLARHENNVTAAARASGVDRVHFYRLLWRHGLR